MSASKGDSRFVGQSICLLLKGTRVVGQSICLLLKGTRVCWTKYMPASKGDSRLLDKVYACF